MRTVVTRPLILLILLGTLSSTFCVPWSCHKGLPSDLGTHWKLCIKRNQKNVQLRIANLFIDTNTGILAIGFMRDGKKSIDLIFEIIKEQKTVKLKHEKLNCTLTQPKQNYAVMIVKCNMLSNDKYLSSENVEIYYTLAKVNRNIDSDEFMKNHKSLTFYFHQKPQQPSKVMKFPESMAAIVGIAVLLTTIITVTICCCCKNKETPKKSKAKKDVSVAFYRDNGEAESENSENDENVAFIPNNNGQNSNV